MGAALTVIGYLVALVGGIWILVLAFRKSVWWGLGSLFIPFVGIVFAIMNWTEAKVPFLIEVGGVVLIFIGLASGGNTLAAGYLLG